MVEAIPRTKGKTRGQTKGKRETKEKERENYLLLVMVKDEESIPCTLMTYLFIAIHPQ